MESIDTILQELRAAPSIKAKQVLLHEADTATEVAPGASLFTALLKYCYDPDMMFHVTLEQSDVQLTGANLSLTAIYGSFVDTLEQCLFDMSATQNKARLLAVINQAAPSVAELLVCIVNKDLKAGVGSKSVLKCFPGLYTVFTVQLANKYNPKKFYDTQTWLCSTKLDGLRCIALRIAGVWSLFTREGTRIHTCQHIIEACQKFYCKYGYTFLEGELYQYGIKFEQIQSMVMSRNDPDAGRGLFFASWCFGLSENFLDGQGNFSFYMAGDKMIKEVLDLTDSVIVPVEQITIPNDPAYIQSLTDKVIDCGGEGIMLRHPKYTYDFKRSDLLLKSKRMETMEGVICDVITGELTKKMAGGGNESYQGMKAVTIKQENGEYCEVGSGWSYEDRIAAYQHPSTFIGRTIEVAYQNLTNSGKCRFPVFKNFRLDKEVVDA